MADSIPISVQGYARLSKELEELKRERPKIVQAIKEAREEGDLRENAGYDAAKERQGIVEARIKQLEVCLCSYKVIDLDKQSGKRSIFGSTVKVVDVDTDEEQVFTLLGPDESDPQRGIISYMSPVGKMLIGREVGDEVTINIPRGSVTYEVLSIDFLGSKIFEK